MDDSNNICTHLAESVALKGFENFLNILNLHVF